MSGPLLFFLARRVMGTVMDWSSMSSKANVSARWGALLCGAADRAPGTGGVGVARGVAAEAPVGVRAWITCLQNLQRMGRVSHSAGMRNTFWQWGHLAWTTCVMS